MKTIGLISATYSGNGFGGLTKNRTLSSLPFCGRYRLIDFSLSNMVNSGIRNVGVIMQKNYHSLMDHLGSGKEWDLHTRQNGLFILPILSAVSQFVMTKLTEAKNPQPAPAANGQQQPNSGAFMKWFFPLFSLWICASSNAAFALYWVVTNLFSLVSNQIINWKLDADEKKDAANPAVAIKGELK